MAETKEATETKETEATATEETTAEETTATEESEAAEETTAEEQTEAAGEAETNESSEDASKVSVKSAGFAEAAAGEDKGSNSMDMILNMSVPVTVGIGTTQISIQRLLQLGPGSIVKLEKPISDPMELYLNGSQFATGEVVVIDDQFAIRIKSIIDDSDSQNGEK